jgi:hypothetical protein
MCFTVTDLTRDEAASIFGECRQLPVWGYTEFLSAVGKALNGTFKQLD